MSNPTPTIPRSTRATGRAARVELTAAAVVTAFVVVLHVRYFVDAGPLWRDEISTVELASSPTLGGLFHGLGNDSVPLLWPVLMRAWDWVGGGRSDRGLRALGLLVGLGTVAAVWRAARTLGARSPLIAMVLLGMAAPAVCYGDSLRAYGAAMGLGLLSTAAMFAATRAAAGRPAVAAVAGAGVAALASAHALFPNAVWVLAVCVAGAAVCATHGRWGRAVAILGVGAAVAASMAVYVPMFRDRARMAPLFVYPTTASAFWAGFRHGLTTLPVGGGATHADVAWACGIAAAVAAAAARRRQDAAGFCLVVLAVGVPAYAGLLYALQGMVQWYYLLPLMAMAAPCLDGAWATVRQPGVRLVGVAAACGWAVVTGPDAWRCAGLRMSNVDLAAAWLEPLATAGDVIVVTPFWLAGPFVRYYHGPAEVVVVPPVAVGRYQRFDLLMQAMHDPHAIDPALARLAAVPPGHHVWAVQTAPTPLLVDPRVPIPPPPPTAHDRAFYFYWNQQVSRLLLHGRPTLTAHVVEFGPAGVDVNRFEQAQVIDLRD